jgi:hypothetical protein
MKLAIHLNLVVKPVLIMVLQLKEPYCDKIIVKQSVMPPVLPSVETDKLNREKIAMTATPILMMVVPPVLFQLAGIAVENLPIA